MADLSRTIELIFAGTDDASRAIRSVSAGLDDMASNVGRVAEPLADFTKTLLAVEAGALGLAAAFAVDAVKASNEFAGAQVELAKLLDESEGSVDSFNGRVFALSEQYGQFAESVIGASADFKRSGFETEAAFQLVERALQAAIAGEIEASEASELLKASLAGFRIEATDSATAIESVDAILDVINKSANNFNVTFAELLQGFTRLSPTASAANASFDETVAALVPVISVFQSGEESANALRTVFGRLVSENSNVVDGLKLLGVSQTDANGKLRDGIDIYFDTVRALAQVDQSEQQRIATLLADTEQSGKLLAAAGGLDQSLTVLNGTFKSQVTVLDEVNAALDSAPAQVDRLEQAWRNFRIVAGKEFEDELKGVNQALATIFTTLRNSVEAGDLDGLFDAIEPQLVELERIARQIAENLPQAFRDADFSGFSKGIQALFGDLENVNVTSEDLKEIIEGVGNAFASLSQFSRGALEIIGGAASTVAPLVKAFLDLDAETQRWLGQIGGAAVVLGPVLGLTQTFAGALSGLAGFMGTAAGSLRTLLTALGTGGLLSTLGSLTAAGGVGLLTYQIGRWADLNDRLIPGVDTLGTKLFDWLDATNRLSPRLEALAASSNSELKAVQDLAKEYQALVEITNPVLETAEDQKAINDALTESFKEQGLAYDAVTGALTPLADALAETQQQTERAEELARGYNLTLVDGIPTYTQVGNAIGELADETKTMAERVDEAANKSSDFLLEWLKIQAQEREALFKIAADVDIAEVEAAADAFEAAFGSIAAGFESSGNILSSALDQLGAFADVNTGFNDAFDLLERSIDREFDIREQLVDSQSSLNDALADFFLQRAEAARRGESEIKISTEGLSPALELVMFEIAEKMRVAVTADEGDFLLAVGGGA